MGVLTREDILKGRPSKYEDVPAFGGTVRIQGLTSAERDLFEQRYSLVEEVEPGVTPNIRALLVAHCAVDSTGGRMFGAADVPALGGLPGDDMGRLFKVAQRLSGMDAELLEDTEKKLKQTGG